MKRSHAILSATAGAALLVYASLGTVPFAVPTVDCDHQLDEQVFAPSCAVPASREVAGTERGPYGAPVGTTLRFAYRVHEDVAMHTEHAAPKAARLGCIAEHCVAVLARDAECLVVRSWFEHVRLSPDAQDESAAEGLRLRARAASSPVLVKLAHDGELLGYRFGAHDDATSRNFVRTLVSRFMFRVAAGSRWVALQHDAAGSYRAEFRELPAEHAGERHVARQRVGYERVAALGGKPAAPQLAGSAHATFAGAIGWLVHATLDEQQAITLADFGQTIRSTAHGELRLIAHAGDGPVDAAALQGSWAPAAGDAEDRSESAERRAARLRREVGNLDPQAALTGLRQMLDDGSLHSEAGHAACAQLAERIEIEPALAQRLFESILRGELSGDAATVVLCVIGRVQLPATQAVLARAMGEVGLDSRLRAVAAIATQQVAEPTQTLLGSLAKAATDLDPRVASSALLAWGTATGRVGAGQDQPLLWHESRAQRSGMLGAWLDALGNAGTAPCLTRLEHYAEHAEPELRRGAVHSLGSCSGPRASARLLSAALQDHDAAVRATAVEALGGRRNAVASLVRIARDDAVAHVRQSALFALDKAAGVERDAALRFAADHDGDAAVRATARDLLAAPRQRGR